MVDQTFNILILCTGNSARSIMAEALFNTLGKGRFKAYSAGSFPNGKVNPYAIEMIQATGYPTAELRSKSWDEFTLPNAPQMDFVITVCDNAANEVCPVWPGAPITAHWGFEDPAALEATEDEKRALFKKIFHQIRTRIDLFLQLPLSQLNKHALKDEMDYIGQTQGDKQ
jgi:arsenate reductase (thioredoxin)